MIVNGKKVDLQQGKTVLDLLESYGLSKDQVVVELNEEIISKETYQETVLRQEDRIEIISFVGGG